jgi:monofunctional biosynthetic peptidoglycan transglycosylase
MVRRTFLIVGSLLAASCGASALYLAWLPDVTSLRSRNPMTTRYVQIYVRRLRRKGEKPATNMHWVRLSEISPYLVRAVLIAEDDRFYRHRGVDWAALEAAMRYNWEHRKMVRGASTISQQVARNLFLSPSRSLGRKIREILIARHLERTLGKDRILEIYLNVAEWGEGIFGAEAASRAYFGKSASRLTAEEAVELAAALPSPYERHPNAPPDERLKKLRRVYRERLERAGIDAAPSAVAGPKTSNLTE